MPVLPLSTRRASLAKDTVNFGTLSSKDSVGLAEAIKLQSGVSQNFIGNIRPIRISHMRKQRTATSQKNRLISSLWPGDSYSFEIENEYLQQYENSHYAFSPKKGGWDTMRTTEIVFSGSIPIIPDLSLAHPLTLYSYPKDFLSEVWELAKIGKLPVPLEEDHQWLMEWANRHLTCEAQAEFVLRESGFVKPSSGKVLFIDLGLQSQPDYVSMGVLVGLHRVLGDQLQTLHAPEFLTSRDPYAPSGMYGKGFGYFGELSDSQFKVPQIDSLDALIQVATGELKKGSVELLVVCGLESFDSMPLKRRQYIDPLISEAEKSALVHGGDSPLDVADRQHFARSSMLFLREF